MKGEVMADIKFEIEKEIGTLSESAALKSKIS